MTKITLDMDFDGTVSTAKISDLPDAVDMPISGYKYYSHVRGAMSLFGSLLKGEPKVETVRMFLSEITALADMRIECRGDDPEYVANKYFTYNHYNGSANCIFCGWEGNTEYGANGKDKVSQGWLHLQEVHNIEFADPDDVKANDGEEFQEHLESLGFVKKGEGIKAIYLPALNAWQFNAGYERFYLVHPQTAPQVQFTKVLENLVIETDPDGIFLFYADVPCHVELLRSGLGQEDSEYDNDYREYLDRLGVIERKEVDGEAFLEHLYCYVITTKDGESHYVFTSFSGSYTPASDSFHTLVSDIHDACDNGIFVHYLPANAEILKKTFGTQVYDHIILAFQPSVDEIPY